MQDLWQAGNEILSIIFLKEFIKINAYTDMMIKTVKLAKLIINIASVFFWNTQTLKMSISMQKLIINT